MIKLVAINSNTGEELFTRFYRDPKLSLEKVFAKGEMYVRSEQLNSGAEILLKVSFDKGTEKAY